MKEICLDEGTIQAFLDGELKNAQMDAATRHLALCDECTLLLSAAEEESAFAFSALEGDLNTLVPTQRLWSKINDSIIEEKRQNTFWYNFKTFLTNISRPSAAAFASLLIVFGVFTVLLVSRPDVSSDIARTPSTISRPTEIATIDKAVKPAASNETPVIEDTETESQISVPTITKADFRPAKTEKISAVKTIFVKSNQTETNEYQKPKTKDQRPDLFLSGEETYIRTISNLSETVNSQKDTAMKPSARFAYEKDLAVINDAIDKMKKEVKRNPKNEAAKDILFASYQNKINLLNSVTERTELMASIR